MAGNQSRGLDWADLLSIKLLEKSNIIGVSGLKGDIVLQKKKERKKEGNSGPGRWMQECCATTSRRRFVENNCLALGILIMMMMMMMIIFKNGNKANFKFPDLPINVDTSCSGDQV